MKSHKKYSYFLYWMCDDQKRTKNLQCKCFYLIFGKVNVYFQEINGNKYLMPPPTNESNNNNNNNNKNKNKYGELWSD